MIATPAAPWLGVAAVVAGIVMTCAAFDGSVVTIDGRRIEGAVSLEIGPALAVKAKSGAAGPEGGL